MKHLAKICMCWQYGILDTVAYRITGLPVVCEFRPSQLGSLNYIYYPFLIISNITKQKNLKDADSFS